MILQKTRKRFKVGFLAIISFSFLFTMCSGRFVKRDLLKSLNKKYSSTYVLQKDTDIGNNQKLKAGTKIKLYILSDSTSVKVYAYSYLKARENTLGKNILYLLETDFEKEIFNIKKFEKELKLLIKSIE